MTNQDVINSALFELMAISQGQTPQATESADMLAKLNQMMAAWAMQDKDIGFPPQTVLTASCPIPVWAEMGVICNLAIYAASSFVNGVVTNTLLSKADEGMRLIGNKLISLNRQPSDMSHLPMGRGRWRHNITTDI